MTSNDRLEKVVGSLQPNLSYSWACQNYKSMIIALAHGYELSNWCEIGGGREPVFGPQEIAELGVHYTVNDISQAELDLRPPQLGAALFDICGSPFELASYSGRFDLIFSSMVFEHLPDAKGAWRNTLELLRPGGVAIAFFPTLYSPPFLINHLVPEKVSRTILHWLHPHRKDDGTAPKFPAYYDFCYGSEKKLAPMLRKIGFAEYLVIPFWGTPYLRNLFFLRDIEEYFNRMAQKLNCRTVTSYAYVIVRKSD